MNANRTIKLILISVLVIAVGVFTGCKKDKIEPEKIKTGEIELEKAHTYTEKMDGIRKWHGFFSYSYTPPDTGYGSPSNGYGHMNDTVFALTIVDAKTVAVSGEKYPLEKVDSARHILYFGLAWQHTKYGVGRGVTYYYDKNSMVLFIDGYQSHSRTYDEYYYTY